MQKPDSAADSKQKITAFIDLLMRLIFEINAYIELKSRISVIIYYLSINNDFEMFKKLHLFPTSCSWSGSELPLIQNKIDFLTELKEHLTYISYLQHKAFINELIEDIENYKEKTEIEERPVFHSVMERGKFLLGHDLNDEFLCPPDISRNEIVGGKGACRGSGDHIEGDTVFGDYIEDSCGKNTSGASALDN